VNINTNNTYATKYEGFAVGYNSATEAWGDIVQEYTSHSRTYPGKIYENVGWVKGTKEAYGSWGGYLWLLQNTVAFRTSDTDVWVSPGGVTSHIAQVLVGTIGDYAPMANVADVGPMNWNGEAITDYLGAGQAEDFVCRGDFTAYYQLITAEVKFDKVGAICASTTWCGEGAPERLIEESRLNIVVTTQPEAHEDLVNLEVESVTPVEPETENGDLWQDIFDPSKWYYDAFLEAKTEKHPVPKRVDFAVKIGDSECATRHILVIPVFDHLAFPVFDYPEDRNEAWRYVIWKYGVSTFWLTSISYDPNQTEFPGLTSTFTDACTLGPPAFSTENFCASTIAHENVHGQQTADYIFSSQASWAAGFAHFAEVDAYNVELQKAEHHGLSESEIAEITAWRDYYNREGPKPD